MIHELDVYCRTLKVLNGLNLSTNYELIAHDPSMIQRNRCNKSTSKRSDPDLVEGILRFQEWCYKIHKKLLNDYQQIIFHYLYEFVG